MLVSDSKYASESLSRDVIAKVVWSVSRSYGLQTCNTAPTRLSVAPSSAVPATAFLVSENLASLLLDDLVPRLQQQQQQQHAASLADPPALSHHDALCRALYDLHATIFQPFRQWCEHVELPRQPSSTRLALERVGWGHPTACNVLLHELALWFLLWTEASCIRHAPEALWFLFWTLQHHPTLEYVVAANARLVVACVTPPRSACWAAGAGRPASGECGGRAPFLELALAVRRRFGERCVRGRPDAAALLPWQALSAAKSGAAARGAAGVTLAVAADADGGAGGGEGADPAGWCSAPAVDAAAAPDPPWVRTTAPEATDIAGVLAEIQTCAQVPVSAEDRLIGASAPCAAKLALELRVCGDGGQLLERMIEPFFSLEALELSLKFAGGVGAEKRLGYDDINESFCNGPRVHSLLRYLHRLGREVSGGYVTSEASVYNLALDGLTLPKQSVLRSNAPPPTLDPLPPAATPPDHSHPRPPAEKAAPTAPAFEDVPWSKAVVKTYTEKRGWAMLIRNYGSMVTLHVVMIYLQTAVALWGASLDGAAFTAVLHAACVLLSRCCHVWCTDLPASALSMEATLSRTLTRTASSSRTSGSLPRRLASTMSMRTRTALQQQPLSVQLRAAVASRAHAAVLFACLLALWALSVAPATRALCAPLWYAVALLYGAVWGFYVAMLTRAGHMSSLIDNLPSWLGGLGDAGGHIDFLYRSMEVTWDAFGFCVASWLAVLALKAVADYRLFVAPTVTALRPTVELWAARPLPPAQHAVVAAVVAARAAPALILCVANTFVYALLVHLAFKLALDVSRSRRVLSHSWVAAVRDWGNAASAFWHSCLSERARAAQLEACGRDREGPRDAAAAVIAPADRRREQQLDALHDLSFRATVARGALDQRSLALPTRAFVSLRPDMTLPFSKSAADGWREDRPGVADDDDLGGAPTCASELAQPPASPPPAAARFDRGCVSDAPRARLKRQAPPDQWSGSIDEVKPDDASPRAVSETSRSEAAGAPGATARRIHPFAADSISVMLQNTARVVSLLSVDMRDILLVECVPIESEDTSPASSAPSTAPSASESPRTPVSAALRPFLPLSPTHAVLHGMPHSLRDGGSLLRDADTPRAPGRRAAQLPLRWQVLASVWAEIVAELRARDLVSDAERRLLSFKTPLLPVCEVDGAGGGGELVWRRTRTMPAFYGAQQAAEAARARVCGARRENAVSTLGFVVVALALRLQLLSEPQAAALLRCCTYEPAAGNGGHARVRRAALRDVRAAAQAMAALSALGGAAAAADAAPPLHAAAEALLALLDAEANAVELAGRGGGGIDAVRRVVRELRRTLTLAAVARALEELQAGGGGHGDDVREYVQMLRELLVFDEAQCAPSVPAAAEALAFFLNSLQSPELEAPAPLAALPSHSVLTPVYREDVFYAVDAVDAAAALGFPPAAAAGISDLLTRGESGACTLDYLRNVHPLEWRHWAERMAARPGEGASAASIADSAAAAFGAGGALEHLSPEVVLWASFRGQLLGRTVRGILLYGRALDIVAGLEDVDGAAHGGAPPARRGARKFQYVVSCQRYGDQRKSGDARDRLLAAQVDELMAMFPELQIAFIDSESVAGRLEQASVLLAAGGGGGPPQEAFRIRLPRNWFTKSGVILGEGKGENQNHALIFTRGECIQVIDMNQDNTLSEALKMPNLLSEFVRHAELSGINRALASLGLHFVDEEDSPPCEEVAEGCQPSAMSALERRPSAFDLDQAQAAPRRTGGCRASAAELLNELAAVKAAEQELFMAGMGEHIFSGVAGSMATMSATMETSFQALYSVYAAAGAKAHYGHPDVMNKLFIITRGGLSKATKEVHVSEDVFGAFNHTLRGGKMVHATYMTVQKGRDLALESINLFETKITRGQVQVWCSRDAFRLLQLLDPFRQLHFVYAYRHAGHFIGSWAVFQALTAYAWAFSLCAVAASARAVLCPPSSEGGAAAPPPTPFCAASEVWGVGPSSLGWHVPAMVLFQTTAPMLLPHLAETLVQKGARQALRLLRQHLGCGWLLFSIVMERSKAWHIGDTMCHGGTTYLPTGRRFGISHYPMVQMLVAFAQSHMWYGVYLALLAAASALLLACTATLDATAAAALAILALVSCALVWSPVLFNPFSFDPASVRRDARDVAEWLGVWRRRVDGACKPCAWAAQYEREATRVSASNEGRWRGARFAAEAATNALLLWLAAHHFAGAPALGRVAAGAAALAAAGCLLQSSLQMARPRLAAVLMWGSWAADAALAGAMLAISAALSNFRWLHSWQVQSLFGAAHVRDGLHAVAATIDAKAHRD